MAVDDIDGVDLMPLETPVLKVSRPVAACSRCRNAKIKCDGKLPACTSCERSGRAVECTSTNDQFARGKERSYVSTLETRIDRLQAKLEDAHRRKPSVISLPDEDTGTAVPSRRASYEPTGSDVSPTPTTSKAQRRKEASAIDDLVSGFGFLSVNATARDFYGFTSAMSYARLILSACSKDDLPQGTTKALPPRHVATQLAQHYLNNVFQLIPVFDEASFYASVDNVYHRDPNKADSADYWMVRMVLAIASASLSERSGDQHYLEGIGHVCAALEQAEDVLHPGSISSVQALVLLVEYAMLDPHHFDSWSLIGAASRAMVDLGLHVDPPKGASMSKGKLELRRRVFWCVYTLDRSTSLVQTRAFSFSDDSAKVKVPFAKQPASQPTSPAPQEAPPVRSWLQSHQQALDLISLRQIQSSWYTDLFQSGRTSWQEPYPYIWKVCNDMRSWFEGVSVSASPNMRAFFELDLLYSYVYVLSPSPRVPNITPFAQTLIFEYCIRYAELMQRLISDPNYTAPTTFYDAMRVYMTGRQFLDVLQQNLDSLLNGVTPPRPEVRPSAAPPPSLPSIMLPPGDTVQHYNTLRSVNCIKQITECLAHFGVRWGYMSWNQRYQKETTGMLDELTGRLRELEIMAGVRRPSMWQHTSSTGSIGSNHGSSHYGSPHNSVQGQAMYPSPPPMQSAAAPPSAAPGYSDAATSHVSPPQYLQQLYQPPANTFPATYAVQPPHALPSTQQQFSFNDPSSSFPNPAFGTAPHQQFGNWGGYGGPSVPDTLDEENAVPPVSVGINNELGRITAEFFSADTQGQQLGAVLPNELAGQYARGFSMHDASNAMLWETFHYPGPTEQCTLPPKTARNSSFGLPLHQIDSNVALNLTVINKGKEKAQQLDVNDPGFKLWDAMQMPPPSDPSFHFTATPGWEQAPAPPISQGPQHAHPKSSELAISYSAQASVPAFSAPSTQQPTHAHPLPQPHHHQPSTPYAGALHPNPYKSYLSQLPLTAHPHGHPAPHPTPTTTSDYRYQPNVGFVCQVCGMATRVPGSHPTPFGEGEWCLAHGQQENSQVQAERERKKEEEAMESERRRRREGDGVPWVRWTGRGSGVRFAMNR